MPQKRGRGIYRPAAVHSGMPQRRFNIAGLLRALQAFWRENRAVWIVDRQSKKSWNRKICWHTRQDAAGRTLHLVGCC
jgi:hypothetical protein